MKVYPHARSPFLSTTVLVLAPQAARPRACTPDTRTAPTPSEGRLRPLCAPQTGCAPGRRTGGERACIRFAQTRRARLASCSRDRPPLPCASARPQSKALARLVAQPTPLLSLQSGAGPVYAAEGKRPRVAKRTMALRALAVAYSFPTTLKEGRTSTHIVLFDWHVRMGLRPLCAWLLCLSW